MSVGYLINLGSTVAAAVSAIASYRSAHLLGKQEKSRLARETLVAVKKLSEEFRSLRSPFSEITYEDFANNNCDTERKRTIVENQKRYEKLIAAYENLLNCEIAFVVITKKKDYIYSEEFLKLINDYNSSFDYLLDNRTRSITDKQYMKAYLDTTNQEVSGYENEFTKRLISHLAFCEKELKKYI